MGSMFLRLKNLQSFEVAVVCCVLGSEQGRESSEFGSHVLVAFVSSDVSAKYNMSAHKHCEFLNRGIQFSSWATLSPRDEDDHVAEAGAGMLMQVLVLLLLMLTTMLL